MMDFKKIKKEILRKLKFIGIPIYKYFNDKMNRFYIKYSNYYDSKSIQRETVLFESRDGQSFTGNPYAIYKYMLESKQFDNFKFYWVYSEDSDLDVLKYNFNIIENQRAHFVKRNSKEYAKLMVTCEYIITNSTFQYFYIKKEGQTYINTWHGTPLKYMGFDIPDNPFASQNVLRNFLMTDYILSPNSHTTNIFLDSYKLKGLYNGEILENGYPRIDLTLNTKKEVIFDKLNKVGIQIDQSKKTLLYTPTWKGTDLGNPDTNIQQIISELSILEQSCFENYNVLIKVHPYVYKQVEKEQSLVGRLVPDCYDANEIMAITDILITDYSSIFFDYLVTDKPVIFYSWDNDLYKENRGMYFSENELPGPIAYTIFEVIELVKRIDEVQSMYQIKYEAMKAKMVAYDDGNSTKKYVDYIFNKQGNIKNIRPFEDKKHLLIYPGGFANNGITSSLLNLLDNIDYSQYDVTLLCSTNKNEEILNNLYKVNDNVRLMFRVGAGDYKFFEQYKDKFIMNRSLTDKNKKYYPKKAYQREARRLSGCCHFEAAIDFSGYSYFWAKFIVNMDADRKLVFQHNDLYSDAHKVINDSRPHYINLRGIFSLYSQFDEILSVSPLTRNINYQNLKQYAPKDKFQYCLNTINIDKILNSKISLNNRKKTLFDKVNKKFKVKSSGIFKVFPNIFDTKNCIEIMIEETQEIYGFSKLEYENEILYKVLIDNVYYGWISSINLIPVNAKIVQRANKNQYAIVTEWGGESIYSEPYGITNNSYRRSALGYFKRMAIFVKEVIITDMGNYACMYYDDKFIGWTNEKNLTYKDHISKLFLKINHKKISSQLKKMPSLSESINRVGYIKNKNVKLYNHECGNSKSKELKDIDSSMLVGQNVIVNYKLKYGDLTSYKINIPGSVTCWIKSSDLSLYNYDNEPCILKRESIDSVILYPVVDTLSVTQDLSHYYDLKVSENKEFYTSEKIWTRDDVMLSIYDSDQQFIGYGAEHLFEIISGTTDINGNIVLFDNNKINFVSMGRLSPEKNQKSLISAINLLFIKYPKYRECVNLYIIGNGVLLEELKSYVSSLELESNIIFLGQKDNPFKIMKQMDCFILSSIYEGQPMVLLEALTLQMDIIATNIPANEYVLNNGRYGLLTRGTDAFAIEEAIEEYILNKDNLSFESFNYKLYNTRALEGFYNKLN